MTRALVVGRGSQSEGTGHVVRALTIRGFLDYRGVPTHTFLELDAPLGRVFADAKPTVDTIGELDVMPSGEVSYDLCFVDRYVYDMHALKHYQSIAKSVIVFDELERVTFEDAFRASDIIVRAQLLERASRNPEASCTILRGLDYFVIKRPYPDIYDEDAAREYDVLVMLGGGAGYERAYEAVAKAARQEPRFANRRVCFVLGANASQSITDTLRRILPDAEIVAFARDPLALMRASRTGIMSGGYSKYEAAYAGLPMTVLAVQDHQNEIGRRFCEAGGGVFCGDVREDPHELAAVERAVAATADLLIDAQKADALALGARKLIDGAGIDRIYEEALKRIVP